ncbi:POTRA domain-containing protein [Pannonibacter sp. Pt2-lr]
MTGAGLFAAARRLEEVYTRAGYVLVRVSLPPQTIRNGKPLRLVVTDGQIETVDVSALPARVQGHVRAVIAPLSGKARVTQAELERRLLLAGDTPGLILRSTLKAGSQPGTTVIAVDGRHDAISATVTMDNSTGKDLGGYTAGLGVDFNSLLGFGETAYLRANGYPGLDGGAFSDDPRNRQLIAGVTVPLGAPGPGSMLRRWTAAPIPSPGCPLPCWTATSVSRRVWATAGSARAISTPARSWRSMLRRKR